MDCSKHCSSIQHTSRCTRPLVMSEEADFQNGLSRLIALTPMVVQYVTFNPIVTRVCVPLQGLVCLMAERPHLESGVYGGGPLALSLPILAQSLQVLGPRENPRRPLQGRSSRQELGSGHLRPHLGTEHRVCQADTFMGWSSRLVGEKKI